MKIFFPNVNAYLVANMNHFLHDKIEPSLLFVDAHLVDSEKQIDGWDYVDACTDDTGLPKRIAWCHRVPGGRNFFPVYERDGFLCCVGSNSVFRVNLHGGLLGYSFYILDRLSVMDRFMSRVEIQENLAYVLK